MHQQQQCLVLLGRASTKWLMIQTSVWTDTSWRDLISKVSEVKIQSSRADGREVAGLDWWVDVNLLLLLPALVRQNYIRVGKLAGWRSRDHHERVRENRLTKVIRYTRYKGWDRHLSCLPSFGQTKSGLTSHYLFIFRENAHAVGSDFTRANQYQEMGETKKSRFYY